MGTFDPINFSTSNYFRRSNKNMTFLTLEFNFFFLLVETGKKEILSKAENVFYAFISLTRKRFRITL